MKYRFLPVFLIAMLLAVMAMFSPAVDIPTVQAQWTPTPGAMMPLGDALGDVGQYYSNISASMGSVTYIQNTSSSNNTATITVYSDTGSAAASLTCTIPGSSTASLKLTDATNRYMQITNVSGNCSNKIDASGYYTASGSLQKFSGVYHVKVVGTSNLAVVTRTTQRTGDLNTIANDANGAYMAVSSPTTEVVFPGIKVDRSGSERHDSEIVVWNIDSTNSITVSIELCPYNGSGCYSNNSASIGKNERRIFTASQLQYAPNNGSLTEQGAWLSARVKKTGGSGTGFVAMASVFKQNLDGSKIKAENGSDRYFQIAQPEAATTLYIPAFVKGTNTHRVLIANNDLSNSATITAKLYNSAGTNVGTWSNKTISAKGNLFLTDDDSDISGTASGVYSMIITANRNLTAQHWFDNGTDLHGEAAIASTASNAYAPYIPDDTGSWSWQAHYQDGNSLANFHLLGSIDGGSESTLYSNLPTKAYYNWSASVGSGNHYGYLTRSHVGAPTIPWGLGVGMVEIHTGGSGDDHLAYNMPQYDVPTGLRGATTWYVPFAPAPVLAFEEATNPFNAGGYGEGSKPPGVEWTWNGNQGESYPADLTGWVYTTWGVNASICGSNSRYIPRTGHNKNDAVYGPAVIALRNLIPSACAGRPLLMYNEPVVETGSSGSTNPSSSHPYSAPNMASAVFRHRTFPGSLEGFSYSIASFHQYLGTYTTSIAYDGNKINRPSFGNIEHWYGQITGSTILPLDRIALHLYVGADHVCNVAFSPYCPTPNVIQDGYTSGGGPYDIKKRLTDWRDYICDWNGNTCTRYGSMEYRFDEWGIAANETAETKTIQGDPITLEGQSPRVREMVRSGMVDLAKVTSEVFSGIYSTSPTTATVRSLHWFIGYQENCHVSTAYYAGDGSEDGDGTCYGYDGNAAQGGGSVYFLAQNLSNVATTVVLTSTLSNLNQWGLNNVAMFTVMGDGDRYLGESGEDVEKVKINAETLPGPTGYANGIYTYSVPITRAVGGTTARAWSASDAWQRQLRTQLYHHDATSLIGTWVDKQRDGMTDDNYTNKRWNDVGACYNTLRTGWTSTSSEAPTTGICFNETLYGTSANSGHWP